MIKRMKNLFSCLKRDESGSASVEFVLVVPVFISLMLMSIELGFITLRQTMLERGLDIAVREVRLGTGQPGSHAEIKQLVCDSAGFILDCENNLRLEMRSADLRSYNSMNTDVLCTDKAEEVDPITLEDGMEFGTPNELMLMRACYKYDPFFPDDFLGNALVKDTSGQARIVALTAFVQEPL